MTSLRPQAAGLYDPNLEHDACGVGAVASLSGERSHETVERALHVLDHLEHRGASGAEADTGDGAGILLQLPDRFLRDEVDFELPEEGRYAVGVCFLPKDEARRREVEQTIEQTVADHGQRLLGWRNVPVDSSVPGASAAAVEPLIRQVFVGCTLSDADWKDGLAFERKIYVIRRIVERAVPEEDLAIPSFSARTIVYKGMLTSPQLPEYFPELRDERMVSALALQHEHLPELGARASVPADRPQRRDQHAARQRQLDARARVAARVGAVRRRPPARDAGGAAGRVGLGHVRQRARAARAVGPLAAARADDDDPGGVGRPGR